MPMDEIEIDVVDVGVRSDSVFILNLKGALRSLLTCLLGLLTAIVIR